VVAESKDVIWLVQVVILPLVGLLYFDLRGRIRAGFKVTDKIKEDLQDHAITLKVQCQIDKQL